MSYKKSSTIKSDSPGSDLKGSIITKDMMMRAIETRAASEEFYEIEPVEVLDVWIDEGNSDFPIDSDKEKDYTLTGSILGRYIYSEQGIAKSKCSNFRPLNPNINMTPVRGEVVLGFEFLGQRYYTTTLNIFGSPNQNIKKNVSSYRQKPNDVKPGVYFKKSGDDTPEFGYSRRLRPNEGDLIIEGRYQNSIRLGSDQKEEAFTESPNIILSAGHLMNGDSDGEQKHEPQKENAYGTGKREKAIYEDIDKDGSSIYLTTNEELKFTPAVESEVDGAFGPFEGKNILLDSDRIIFNTKNNGSIAMMSSNNIALSSVTSVVIESPEVKVGSNDAEEQMILGTTLIDRLIGLVDAIGNVSQIPTPTGPTPTPINTAAVGWSTPGGVEDAKGALIDALSELHRIDK